MKMMLCVAAIVVAAPAAAQVYVAPHTTSNGTYVEGHMRTAPNSTRLDNYSTRGNVNPYNGREGTVDPYAPRQQSSTSSSWNKPVKGF